MSNIPNKDMKPPKGSLSPGRNRPGLTAANVNRRLSDYNIPDATQGKNVRYGDAATDSSNRYPVKPAGKYKHNFENPFGPEEGERATTVYPNNPLLNNMFSTPEEERDSHIEGINPSNPYNVPYLKKNRQIPFGNLPGYELDERGEVASMLSEPYKRAEERREAAEYAKKSCWQKLMACFNNEKKRRGGSIGGADVTIKDLRDFLDANPDIKNIIVNDECPLNPTEEMIDNVDKFTDMLENSENRDITIDEIYNQDAGKRRKKTRKSRKTKKTKKAKRRTKRTKRRN
jgi:hypothetical protein